MVYPDHARYAKLAAAQLGAEFVDLDRGNGYLFAVTAGEKRFLSGAGNVCSYPINNASSYAIARDKSHTKSVLSHRGIAVIPGRHFFLSAYYIKLRTTGHEADDALAYAAALGYPVFCKPLAGGRGNYAEVVRDEAELRDYMERAGRLHDAILIEPVVQGAEYRVVIHDGVPFYSAAKRPVTIRADGETSVAGLLDALNRRLEGRGVSPHRESTLALSEFTGKDIPPAGTIIPLAGRRNLSALGEVESLDLEVPPPLAKVATDSCEALGLRLGAVDVFDVSRERNLSDLVVIEVNANPGLSALERAGRLDLIVQLWTSMIRESLA